MKTRKRSSYGAGNESKRLQIQNELDYSVENLFINLQPFWHTSHDRTRAVITGIFLNIQQGLWFTILPSTEDNSSISIGVRQDWDNLKLLFLHLGLIRISVENNINIYSINHTKWDSFIALFPQELKLHLTVYYSKVTRNKA